VSRGQLRVVVVPVADDDHPVATMDQMSGGTVETDLTGARRAFDDVGLETSTVVDVDDGDLLELEQIGLPHQVSVDGDRADVVQVRVGDGGAVDLRLHHATTHDVLLGARWAPGWSPPRCL
jgi:hypothetical protein